MMEYVFVKFIDQKHPTMVAKTIGEGTAEDVLEDFALCYPNTVTDAMITEEL